VIQATEPATAVSAAADKTERTEDTELQTEMEQWRQRMTTLKDTENYEDQVNNDNRFCIA